MASAYAGIIFYLIPIAAVLFLVISGVLYFHAKSVNKLRPGTYTPAQLKTRLIVFIVSLVIAGILVAVVVSLMVLLFMAVAFM